MRMTTPNTLFFTCGRWAAKKRELEFMLGEELTPDTAVPLMLRDIIIIKSLTQDPQPPK